jgi:hypothetical protein
MSEAIEENTFTITNASGYRLARPTLSLFLFSDMPLSQLGSAVAGVIERYVVGIGIEKFATTVNSAGEYRPFTTKVLLRDLKKLRSVQIDTELIRIIYDSDPEGWVGEYGVYFEASKLAPDLYEPNQANLLRLDYPWQFVSSEELASPIDFIEKLATDFPLSSGYFGYSLKRTEGTMQSATKKINALLPRFIGFDPCYTSMLYTMKGCSFGGAHWIDLIGKEIIDRLGGEKEVRAKLAGAEVRVAPGVMFIRNAKYPPIGDVNRGATDIGVLPDTARLLKSTRSTLHALGAPDFNALEWLARFDELEVMPWDNE